MIERLAPYSIQSYLSLCTLREQGDACLVNKAEALGATYRLYADIDATASAIAEDVYRPALVSSEVGLTRRSSRVGCDAELPALHLLRESYAEAVDGAGREVVLDNGD